tara:strand:- start:33037 stop:34986 length:1950 start_codon:yes stop_codon:yes gene_type:complete
MRQALLDQLRSRFEDAPGKDMRSKIQHLVSSGMGEEDATSVAQQHDELIGKPIEERMERMRRMNPDMDEGRMRRMAEQYVMSGGGKGEEPEKPPQSPEKIGEEETRPSFGRGMEPAERAKFLQPQREGEDERRAKTVQMGTDSGFGGFGSETILHDPTGQHPLFYGSPRKLQDAKMKHQQASQQVAQMRPMIDELDSRLFALNQKENPTPYELSMIDQLEQHSYNMQDDAYKHQARVDDAQFEMEKHGPKTHLNVEQYLNRMLGGASAGARDGQFGGQGRKGGLGLADFQRAILGQDAGDIGRGPGAQQEAMQRMMQLHQDDPQQGAANLLNHLKAEGLMIDMERSPSMKNLDLGPQMAEKTKGLEAMIQAAQKRDVALEAERKELFANPTPENIQRIQDIDRDRDNYRRQIVQQQQQLAAGHMDVLTPDILAQRVFGQGRDMSQDPKIVQPGQGAESEDLRLEGALSNMMNQLGLNQQPPENESDGERAIREQQIVSARKQFRDALQQGMGSDEAIEQVKQSIEDSKTRFAGEAAPYGTLSVLQPGQGLPKGKVRQDFPHAPQGEDYTLDDSDAPPVETLDKPSWMDSAAQAAKDRKRFGDPFGDFGMQVPEKEEEDEDDDMKQTGFPMTLGNLLMKSVHNRLWWQGL